MGSESLREAVEAHARARLGDDPAVFASYMTSQAVLELGGNGMGAPALPRARSFEILDITHDGGGAAAAAVRFRGAGSYVMRTRWQRIEGAWKATSARVPPDEVRLALWRRLLGQRLGRRPAVKRKDLS